MISTFEISVTDIGKWSWYIVNISKYTAKLTRAKLPQMQVTLAADCMKKNPTRSLHALHAV